jgi:EAL domain-containing protein (putative c-di-GMP-specific phosphodiesterase class I)
MAHNLDITVTAEGVETKEQYAILRECACDLMQGYYFCRALSDEHLISFIGKSHHTHSQFCTQKGPMEKSGIIKSIYS